jgi:hypothetical protein
LFILALLGCTLPALGSELVPWRDLLPGFEMAEFRVSADFQKDLLNREAAEQQEGTEQPEVPPLPPVSVPVVFLRIDPERYEFILHMESVEGQSSLAQLAEEHKLLLAVNAGMYLPDNLTSTGYMRSGAQVNNAKIGARLGSFLVANPLEPGLPPAALLDRGADDWERVLEKYGLVVQNFRLTSTEGEILWPEDGTLHSMVLLGQDHKGRILFLFCRGGLNPAGFARVLLALPLELRSLMYLEGGRPANLFVRAGDVEALWSGNGFASFLGSSPESTIIPNVLGLRAR